MEFFPHLEWRLFRWINTTVELVRLRVRYDPISPSKVIIRTVAFANRERSEIFYSDVLELPICTRFDEQGMKMAFFSLGNHHDLAISEVGEGKTRANDAPGLDHVAFCIRTAVDQLKEAKAHLEATGKDVDPVDHEVTKSLYFNDPNGNGIEVYVDVSDAWKTDPQRVAQVAPLEL